MVVEQSREGLLPGQTPADVWSAWRYCGCGALIWAVLKPLDPEHHLPRYSARVVCHGCGAVHTRHPLGRYQVWWVKGAIKKYIFRSWRRNWRKLWAT